MKLFDTWSAVLKAAYAKATVRPADQAARAAIDNLERVAMERIVSSTSGFEEALKRVVQEAQR